MLATAATVALCVKAPAVGVILAALMLRDAVHNVAASTGGRH